MKTGGQRIKLGSQPDGQTDKHQIYTPDKGKGKRE